MVVRGGEAAADPLTPDLVGTLLRRFVEIVPSGLHRRALEVCAIARVTTEGLLREVLGVEDAHDPFSWLRGLSFVESGPDGVFPHDLARDALEADLRWRDPDGYRRVFRAVRSHINGRLRTSQDQEQQRAIADAKYMFRRLPGVVSPLDWDVWGQQYPEPAGPSDREAILDLVLVGEGKASAAIAARWWEQQPEGFFVVRSHDGAISGFLALLDLTRASPEDIAADPGASAAWDYAQRQAPPRPTETVTLSRFIVDREVYQGPSATLNAMPILTMQRYLAHPEPGLGLPRPGRAGAVGRVLRRRRSAAGRRRRLLGGRPPLRPVRPRLPTGPGGRPVGARDRARPQPGRHAVCVDGASRRCWCCPSRSSTTRCDRRCATCADRSCWRATRCCGPVWSVTAPATRSRTRRRSRRSSATAIETLREHPRDDKRWRAVERTYVRPAGTQERAAEALGLPFSTYRRHLTQGVDQVVAWLWDREVYGEQH